MNKDFVKVLVLGLALSTSVAATAADEALKDQAKVSEIGARATALTLVPNGTVQSAELEREKGKLVWSFDIAEANSANVVEVLVDAKTGRIVSRKIETPAEQAKELKVDRAMKK
jgi:uncharacterized membrane protein YkoI